MFFKITIYDTHHSLKVLEANQAIHLFLQHKKAPSCLTWYLFSQYTKHYLIFKTTIQLISKCIVSDFKRRFGVNNDFRFMRIARHFTCFVGEFL